MKPQFFIIAGPNGAGKSTYAQDVVPEGTFIFNGDLIYADLLKRYPNYDPVVLGGGVAQRLEEDRNAAIAAKKDFCFESNYSNNMATEITRAFKAAGYEANLIYFGLDNIEAATSRVASRVALGGHDIGAEEIKFNLEEGITRVKANFDLYDRIQFVDTSMEQVATTIAFCLKDTAKISIINEHVKWFNKNFRERVLTLYPDKRKQITSEILPKEEQQQKRGRGI